VLRDNSVWLRVDQYDRQTGKTNHLTFICALLTERSPSVIVGLETAVEMNLVQI